MKKTSFIFILFVFTFMLVSCGNNSQDGTGGITAQAIWPSSGLAGKAGAVHQKAPAEVRWIRMLVSNGSSTITSSDFDTTLVNTGTLSGIPAGSGWTLTVQGLDNAVPHAVLYQGSKSGISVVANQTTNAGTVSMQVAVSGILDQTFGTAGITDSTVAPGVPGTEWARGVAVQTDGKIIVAGGSQVRGTTGPQMLTVGRYNVNGTLDNTFNDTNDSSYTRTPGIVSRNTTSFSTAEDVVVLPDGHIVAAGTIDVDPTNQNFILMTFNQDGTFNGGFNGLQTDFGGSDFARSMAVYAPTGNGTIAVAGYSNNGITDRLALALYNANVSTLTSTMTTTVHSSVKAIQANDVAFQADGKIVVAGKFTNTIGTVGFGVARFLSDGVTIDPSFNAAGTPGMVYTDLINGGPTGNGATALAVQPDGKILIAGDVNWLAGSPQFGVLRYNPDGTKDTTFNPGGGVPGEALIDINGQQDVPYAMKVQPDGKILIAGKSGNDFGIARLNSNGTVDTSFGTNGVTTVTFGVGIGFNSQAKALDIAPDGKIIVAGEPLAPQGGWAITRLWNNTTTKAKVYSISNQRLNVISTITSTASTTTAQSVDVGFPPTPMASGLFGVTVDPLGNRLYTSDFNNGNSGYIWVIDTISNKTLSPSISIGSGPYQLVINPWTNRLYVGMCGNMFCDGTTVSVIDITTKSPVGTIPCRGPRGLALNPSANRLYIGNTKVTGSVSVIDTLNNSLVTEILNVPDAMNLKLDPSANRLYAANYGNGTGDQITVIDTLLNTVVTNITVSAGPYKMAVDPDSSRLYVSHYAAGSGNLVSVISTTSNSVLHTIPTGTGPNAIAIDATSKKLYVGTESSSTISIYDVANDTKSLFATMSGGTNDIAIMP